MSGKVIVLETLVREIIDESWHANVRETSCPGNVLSMKRLSGKVIVRETSVNRLREPLRDAAHLYTKLAPNPRATQ